MTPKRDRGKDEDPEDLAEIAGLTDETEETAEEVETHEDSPPEPPGPPTRTPREARPEPEDLAEYVSEAENEALFEQYDLTDLKGIGPARAQALRDAGFDLEALIDADPETVADIEGINPRTATELIGYVRSIARQARPEERQPSGEMLTPEAIEDATLAALDTTPIEDENLDQKLREALTARLQLSDLEGEALKDTVLEGLRSPFENPELEATFIDAIEAHLHAPDASSLEDSAQPASTPEGAKSQASGEASTARASGQPPTPPGEQDERDEGTPSDPETPAGEPLDASEIEDAVLMALQEQQLDDSNLEATILEVMTATLEERGGEPGAGQAVIDQVREAIDDPTLKEEVTETINAKLDTARTTRTPPGQEDPLDEASDGDGPVELMEEDIEDVEAGELDDAQDGQDPSTPALDVEPLDASEIEDAVLMALQEQQLDDPEQEGALLDAMAESLEETSGQPGAEKILVDRLRNEIEDPDVADELAARIEAELAEIQDEHVQAAERAQAAEPEDSEPEDLEEGGLEEAEIEDVDVEELEPEGGAEVLKDLSIEPQEGMPDLQEFHEPESRAEADRARSAPQTTDRDTREIVDEISKEQERRIRARRAEAKELEERAKGLEKQAEEEEKARKEFEKHARYVEDLGAELGFDPNRPITEIPELEGTGFEEIEFSTIQEDYAYIRILYHEDTSRHLYEVLEPELNDTEQEVLAFLQDTLVRTMDGRRDDEAQDWEAYLEEEIERAILDHSILIDRVGKQRVAYHLKRDFLGYGPIDVIMQDSMIEDISCDGPGIPIYVYHRQYESIRTNVVFEEETKLDSFVIRLAQRSGKHISIADPLLDATLPDTSRLQATLSREVTTRGSSFTIRKFRADPLTPPDLIRLGTLSSRMAAFLWIAMEDGSPMLMAGGTASGKTTTLNAMSQYIPPEKKVVSIEDTREINLIHENWIAGLTRSGFAGREGEGSIDMYRLLEAALRQRPEYLLVGEVRGPEAQTLFQAMATGHATYSTLHADSVRSAVYRLENPPIDVPRMMLQTLDAIAVQTQARVENKYVRRIRELTEVVGIDSRTGDLLTNQVYDWDPDTDTYEYLGKSHILERRMEQMNLSAKEIEEEWSNRTLVLDWMVDKGIRHIEDVASVIAAYYARPEAVVERVRAAMDPEDTEELAPENLSEELA